MLFFAGIPFLFKGPVIGAICWTIAALVALVQWTPLRGWLGLPARELKSGTVYHRGQTTVVRVRDSTDVRLYNNIGVGTDSAVDVTNVDGLDAQRNRVLR